MSAITIDDNIYQMALDALDITYTPDESESRKIKDAIATGIDYLNGVAGASLIYTPQTESSAGWLLCAFVRYTLSNDIESFKLNFSGDLLMLRAGQQTGAYYDAVGTNA